MKQDTSTTADARVKVGSLWTHRAHDRRLVEVIQAQDEELGRAGADQWRCPLTPGSTLTELLALGAGCTASRSVYLTLDAIRPRLRR
jgi:hypothetical protein